MNTTIENPVESRQVAVTRARREKLNGHRSVCLWFTGLSGSGKSTLAHAVEDRLYSMGCRTFILDGDDVRHGLDADLGFSREDRSENIRRGGEIARLFVEAGVIIMTAFISPFRADRERVRSLIGDGNFIEIFVKSPLRVCEERDVKGLYRKARAGTIADFTGLSSPYEEPEHPELILDTTTTPVEQCVDRIVDYLVQKKVVRYGNT